MRASPGGAGWPVASRAGLAFRAGRAWRRTWRGWRRLNFEQKTAGVGAVLLLVSTFGPFSWVEAAQIVVALGVLALLGARSEGRLFHLPFGDGAVITVAGAWAGVLIAIRLFERPLGQNLLALACAGVMVLAGLSERAKRPADDLPTEVLPPEGAEPDRAGSAGGGSPAPERSPHQRDAGGGGEELDARRDDQRLG
jgi:hypothetical protein